MMKHGPVRIGLYLTLTALLASSLPGCGVLKSQTHDENAAEAMDRWHAVRSAIFVDMAETQFKAGQLEQCEKSVQDGLAIDSDNPKLLTLYGRIMLEQGRLERAFNLFNAAIAYGEKDPSPHFYNGVVLQRWQKHDEAHAQYREAFKLESDNPNYLLAMSEMLMAMDRSEEAVKLLEDKMIYFGQNAGMRAGLGQIYTVAGRHDEASEMFRQAALLDPDNAMLREAHGFALVASEQYTEALTVFKTLVTDEDLEDRHDLLRALAETHAKAGNPIEAREHYNALVRKTVTDESDWIRLGELSWKAGDPGATLHAANRAIRLAPQRHEGYLLAGLVWQKRGRLDDALRMFDRAAERAPQSAGPLILRGIALQKAERFDDAGDAYTEALKRQPEDPRALRLLKQVADASDGSIER